MYAPLFSCIAHNTVIVNTSTEQLDLKVRKLEAQHRIIEAQAGERDAQAVEIELLRKEIMELKRYDPTNTNSVSTANV